jgi:crotonobetainyl-CoA:carnitine CoA-transferase CaiB-like acyl-CoA transferase
MSINERGDGPIRTGGPVLDYATGMHSTSAVLAAVLLRQQTGRGQRIDIAMQDVTMLLMNRHTSIAATTGVAVPPGANRDGPMLGRYIAKDGYVMLAGYRASHQRSILKAIGLAEFVSLSTAQLMSQMPQIEARVEEVLQQKSAAEWDEIFSNSGVVAGGVKDLIEVFQTGQPEARELTTKVESVYGEHQVTSAGYRINDAVFRAGTHVPELGEHTKEVLTALGYSEDEIALLAEQNIVVLK